MKKLNIEHLAAGMFNIMVFIIISPLLLICIPFVLLKKRK